ncbi:MAG TPA: hypothetical protein VGK78_10530 [Nocardioides sp.]|uniref:hypothetical protein n=1 Tax=Nocardioides sp. TaxID=35761 RepID=UPI002F4140BF
MPLTGRVSARAVDPAAAALVALVVYGVHGFDGTLDRDQGTFVYAGQDVARGVPPFVGIFNSVGPLGDVVTGIGVRLGSLFGIDAVLAARLTYLVASAAAVAALSVLAREALGSRIAGLLTPAVFLTFTGFLELATGGPREKTVMVLCLELALLLMLRRQWFWAGALTALATLTWQPAILSALAAALVALVTSGGSRRRASTSYVAGGLTPVALVAVLYVVSGHLRMAWWGFVVVNVSYTRQPTILTSWRLVTADYRWSTVLVVAGWALTVCLGAAAAARLRRTGVTPVDRPRLVLGAGGLVAGAWSCYAINGGADLFVVLPYAALGVGGGITWAARSLPMAAARRVTAVVAVLAVATACAESLATRDARLSVERRDVTRMAALLPPGSGVESVNAPEVLVLLDRRNPDPWQLSNSATAPFLDDHLDGGLATLAARISARRPGLIAVGRHSVDDWLMPVLDTHYARVGRGDHWVWYASRRLEPAVRQRMREVNTATWGR